MPRGTITPSEVREVIRSACQAKNYDPFKELIELATSKSTVLVDDKPILVHELDTDQRIAVAKELASYLAPKLKNIEVKGEITGNITLTVKSYLASPDKPKELKEPAIDVKEVLKVGPKK